MMITSRHLRGIFLVLALSMCLIGEATSRTLSSESADSDGNVDLGKIRKIAPEAESRIVGGSNAESGRYPYMVALIDKKGNFFCGGTLIEPGAVLTAAHCKGAKYVKIGSYDFGKDEEDDFETIKVQKEIRHPDYKSKTIENDAMILKLEERASVAKPIKVNLAGKNEEKLDDNDKLYVMGWGSTDRKGNKYPDRLQEVQVKYVEECEDIYPEEEITSDMMCAGQRKKDACFGDSGGPLIVRGRNPDDDVQVGIVSWSYGCAYKNYPGVYARTSERGISKFIRKQT